MIQPDCPLATDVRARDQPHGTIVVADDLEMNRELFRRLLSQHGYDVYTAQNGAEALDIIRERVPDLVLSDVRMPEITGVELCHRLKQHPSTRLIPVILITGMEDDSARLSGIEAGADDFLRKPVNRQELIARVRALIRLKRYTDNLDCAESMLLSLAKTVEARDPCTSDHCDRMARYAGLFGAHLQLPADQILALRRGGYLHDIGKIGLPDAILLKAGPLSSAEFEAMKRHTIIGETLCTGLRLLHLVRPLVRQHHERLDGSGYPDGARGEGISLLAQIIGIVDVYDALTTDRPYRAALSPERAYAELTHEVAVGWRRRDLVGEFIRLARTGVLETGRARE